MSVFHARGETMKSHLKSKDRMKHGSERIRGGDELRTPDTRAEEQMAQSQRLESIGMLASGVAHEINNPLCVVMNLAQLIMDDAGSTAETRGHAATIVDESGRMATMLRNLLSFSRNNEKSPGPTDVRTLVDRTLSLVRSSFSRDRIKVVTEIPEGLPKVRCRGQQIQQVLMNLLFNARDSLNARFHDAAPDKVIRVAVRPFEREGEAWIRLTVEDGGVGVPPEVARRMFDPFFTTKPQDKGTGLGLSISYEIMKEHGGEIWFESLPGAGAQFHMDLKTDNGWLPRQVM